jgi:two-component system, OmpR family, sensor kinase
MRVRVPLTAGGLALASVVGWAFAGRARAPLQELDVLRSTVDRQRRFIEDATHELLTPLAIIRGHIELCGDDPAERAATAALVNDEIGRMTRLLDELRLLAHAPRPEFLDLELLDAGVVADDVFAKVRGLAERDWVLERGAGGWLVGDRRRLEQALINLTHNAVQHTAEGDRIALGAAVDGGDARLWVADTGPGVPAHEHARIFERFDRGDAGRRRPGSTGLGLAIVAAIARGHGGRVELTSAPGAGATFALVIPLIAPAAVGPGLESRLPA